MRSMMIRALVLLIATPAYAADKKADKSADSLQVAFDETIAMASQAIHKYGVTDSAMMQIQVALAKLAKAPSLKARASFSQIHGIGTSRSAMLASRGDDSISLFLVQFDTGQATPIHDHLTWGVVHVLEGRDHYVSWGVQYNPKDSSRAEIQIATEAMLEPGSSVYWFGPPHDLHSQEAKGGTLWELVLAGKNLLSPLVLDHRHYYDLKTGRVSQTPPK